MADRPAAGLLKPALVVLLGLGLAGCGTGVVSGLATPAGPVDGGSTAVAAYFQALNAAGAQGSAAQQAFFARTQDPQFALGDCGLAGLTVRETPAWTSLRRDPEWVAPGSARRPAGTVYRVAVAVTVQRNGVTVGDQIGTEHVVLEDGRGYGFAPCSTP